MSFAELKEQPGVAELLQRSLRRGRLAHAYLFAGPRGSGKELTARMLAKALNCLEEEQDCCAGSVRKCDSCRRIDESVHPDVYWVRPESKSRRISVDQIGEFKRAVNLKPTMARVKVGVIVDADCIGEEAGNAFLKTLEEPPAETVILLLSAEPQRLLSTILSRCLKIPFGAVALRASPYREKVFPMLVRLRTRGETRVTGVYRLLAELTGLLQEIRAEIRQRIEAEAGVERFAELEPKTRERLEEQVEARIEGEYRAAREQVLEEMYAWFGDVLLCVEGVGDPLLEHRDQSRAVRQAAQDLTYDQAAINLEAIEQIRESLFRNISEALALEVGLLKVTQ